MRRIAHAALLLVTASAAVVATAGTAGGQQRDTTRAGARAGADSARRQQAAARRPGAARADSTNPRATARDYYGADDPRCDDLCRRERMMDSLYGKDRERLPATAAPSKQPTRRP